MEDIDDTFARAQNIIRRRAQSWLTMMAAQISSPQRHRRRKRPTRVLTIILSLFFVWCACLYYVSQLVVSNNDAELQSAVTITKQRRALPLKVTSGSKDNIKVDDRSNVQLGDDPKQPEPKKDKSKKDYKITVSNNSVQTNDTHKPSRKFILFKPIPAGQGTGQAMNGLLASHLMGDEFNRIVCMTPTYKPFYDAFEPIDPLIQRYCPFLKLEQRPKLISLINYNADPDECHLKSELASDKEIIYIVGNTYPKWPRVPDEYFFRFYKPTPQLLQTFPWKDEEEPPNVVVHLRKADREFHDKRLGLDSKTLQALGKALPPKTFLVTNNVVWFDYFRERFNWTHPNWRAVRHSAFMRFMWQPGVKLDPKDRSVRVQDLQMFSDWYTIACAKQVWHTHSDFSLSAIHWMNVDSKTIMGMEGEELKLIEEPWRREGDQPRLIDRGPEELANCKEPQNKSSLT